jgi:hypothetical protein
MHPQTVADAFGLGRATSLSDPVARGELGEIRRLETDQGTFAVKQELGSWSVDEAETRRAYHRACWEAGIPTPEPLPAMTGGYTAQVDGERVRAYAWAELADPDPTLDPAAVGTLVARLHQVRHPWPTSEIDPWFEAPLGRAEWKGVLKASRAAGAPYAARLAELLPALLEIEEILTPMRSVQTCHLDLWADSAATSAASSTNGSSTGSGPGSAGGSGSSGPTPTSGLSLPSSHSTAPKEIPWDQLSPRTGAILRTVATSASQGFSAREIGNGFGISSFSVLGLIDEARAELRRLS